MTNRQTRACTALSALIVASLAFSVSAAPAPGEFRPQVTVGPDGVRVVRGAQHLGTVTPAVAYVDARQLPVVPAWRPGDAIVDIPRQHWGQAPAIVPTPVNPVASPVDPLLAIQAAASPIPSRGVGNFTTPIINVDTVGSQSSPPDPSGDVGPLHFVQAVNGGGGTSIRIFNKADGTLAAGPFTLNSAGFAGPGAGACTSALGDPIVIYDELAGRWMLTEFSSQAGRSLCVYISATDNPVTTTWFKYAFQMPAFPDYPKYGVWPDAYYVGANENSTPGARPMYALQRAQMLLGNAASFQRVTTPDLSGFGFEMYQPADVDGLDAPPAGAPGIIMRHRDDEVHNAGSNNPTQDFVDIYQLAVDFATPANTTLTGPFAVAIAEFSSNLNGLSAFNAFPQPTLAGAPNGQKLDPLRETVMNRLAYRNMGSHQVLVGNLVTDIDGNDTGGIRWFELRRPSGSTTLNAWALHQEGTWAGPGATQDGADRWMAGISMDEAGNIAMGYSTVRDTAPPIWPSLRYVGRLSSDTLGQMTTGEATLVNGLGTHSNERWGDYFQMGVDPVDQCTFWFIGEYMPTSGSGTKSVRVGSFRFDACGTPTFTVAGNNLNQALCANSSTPVALTPITVSVGSVNGFANPVTLGFGGGSLPTGFAGTYSTNPITPPGSSNLPLTVNNTATPGNNAIQLTGTATPTTKNVTLNAFVATANAGLPTLTAPANGAINVGTTPTLSWTAGDQAQSHVVEVATDSGFTNIVFTQTVNNGSNVQVTPALNSSTTYFWRVRGSNICGASANTTAFSFTTQAAPGDCGSGSTANVVVSENFDAGIPAGWTATGTPTWTASTARPFGGSGQALLAQDITTVSDQRLVTPAIVLPTGQDPVSLIFQSDQTLEDRTGGCWDGGFIEVSTDGGTNFTALPGTAMLTDPYDGPIGDGANPAAGQNAWCGDPQAYLRSIVDLTAFAGQTVRVRFRMTTDDSVGRVPHGWYIDNYSVQSCAPPDTGQIFRNGFE